jgi:hypothetical protein
LNSCGAAVWFSGRSEAELSEGTVTTRRIEIVTEVEREIVVTRRSVRVRYCKACGGETPMVTPELAAAQAAVSVRTIYRWVEAERVHFIETQDGRLLICLNGPGLRGDVPDP